MCRRSTPSAVSLNPSSPPVPWRISPRWTSKRSSTASTSARLPPESAAQARAQRQEDLHFHNVLATANPNPLLRFMCEVINRLLRHLVTLGNQPAHPAYQKL